MFLSKSCFQTLDAVFPKDLLSDYLLSIRVLKKENPIWPRQTLTWLVDSGSAYIPISGPQQMYFRFSATLLKSMYIIY